MSSLYWTGASWVGVGRRADRSFGARTAVGWSPARLRRRRATLSRLASDGVALVAVGAKGHDPRELRRRHLDEPLPGPARRRWPTWPANGQHLRGGGRLRHDRRQPRRRTRGAARIPASATWLLGVAWNGSQFVAVGERGRILTSPDGADVDDPHAGGLGVLFDVLWDGGRFVAVGSAARSSRAPTGSPGRRIATVIPNELNEDRLERLALRRGGRGRGAADLHEPGRGPLDGGVRARRRGAVSAVTWTGSAFVAVGDGGHPCSRARTASSWTERESGASETLYGVAWTGTGLVAVGGAGTRVESADGATWTARPRERPTTCSASSGTADACSRSARPGRF